MYMIGTGADPYLKNDACDSLCEERDGELGYTIELGLYMSTGLVSR